MSGVLIHIVKEWRRWWKTHQQDPLCLPADDDAWREYVNSLSMAEMLELLQLHEEDFLAAMEKADE
jgi:hypothetical protein